MGARLQHMQRGCQEFLLRQTPTTPEGASDNLGAMRGGTESPARVRHYLRAWRLKAGMTQSRLGDLAGYDKGTISRIENGRQNYTQQNLEALAEALQISPAEILGRDPADPESIWQIALQVGEMTADQKSLVMAMLTAAGVRSGQPDTTVDVAAIRTPIIAPPRSERNRRR